MKNLLILICVLTFSLTQANNIKPKYETAGNLVKVTYFYKNGNIRQQGFFKNNKLTGTWTTYDVNGAKTAIANYKHGKKVGKWLIKTQDGLKKIIYVNNKIKEVTQSNEVLN